MLGYEITEICCYFDQLITVSCLWNMPYCLLQPHSQESSPGVFSDVHQAQGSDFFSNSRHHDLHVFNTEHIWNLSCEKTKGRVGDALHNTWQIIFYMVFNRMGSKHITRTMVWCCIYLVTKQPPPVSYVFLPNRNYSFIFLFFFKGIGNNVVLDLPW